MNELLFTYAPEKARITSLVNGDADGIEIGEVDKISSILGGQAIGFVNKQSKQFKAINTCSYSEKFNANGECETCPSGSYPSSKFGTSCLDCGQTGTTRHTFLCNNKDDEWAFKNGINSRFDLERQNDNYEVSQAMKD